MQEGKLLNELAKLLQVILGTAIPRYRVGNTSSDRLERDNCSHRDREYRQAETCSTEVAVCLWWSFKPSLAYPWDLYITDREVIGSRWASRQYRSEQLPNSERIVCGGCCFNQLKLREIQNSAKFQTPGSHTSLVGTILWQVQDSVTSVLLNFLRVRESHLQVLIKPSYL